MLYASMEAATQISLVSQVFERKSLNPFRRFGDINVKESINLFLYPLHYIIKRVLHHGY